LRGSVASFYLSQFLLDAIAKAEPDPRYHPLNGFGCLPLFFCDGLKGHPPLVPHLQDRGVPVGELLPTAAQRFHISCRVIQVIGGLGSEPLGQSLPVRREAAVFAGGGPEFLPKPVPGDRANPCSKVGSGFVLIEVEIGIHEHLLNEVLGGIAIAQQRSPNPPDRFLKNANETSERLGIAS